MYQLIHPIKHYFWAYEVNRSSLFPPTWNLLFVCEWQLKGTHLNFLWILLKLGLGIPILTPYCKGSKGITRILLTFIWTFPTIGCIRTVCRAWRKLSTWSFGSVGWSCEVCWSSCREVYWRCTGSCCYNSSRSDDVYQLDILWSNE